MSGFGVSGYSLVFNPNTALPVRQPARVVSTSNVVNLQGGAPNHVDGVTLNVGDRVLVQGQQLGMLNGIYFVKDPGTGTNGSWARTTDCSVSNQVFDGVEVRVTEGTSNADTLWVLTTNNPIVLDATPLTFTKQVGDGGGNLTVMDEGVTLGTFATMNFIGAQVVARSEAGIANVYIPPPPPITYASHWNTDDGDSGNQAVTDSTSRTSAWISSPIAEGLPFATGGWAGTVQDATRATAATYASPGLVTGFGGNAYVVVVLLDADGATQLATFTTPVLTSGGTYANPGTTISVTLSSYQADSNRYKAVMSVVVSFDSILASLGRQGGRVSMTITMFTDTSTDGSGPYNYTSTPVFEDVGNSPPIVTGSVNLAPTPNLAVLRRLSGLTYYTNGTQFMLEAAGLSGLNSNTARPTGSLNIGASGAGISAFDQSPLPGGSGSGSFTGWSNLYGTNNVDYAKADNTLNKANYRQVTKSAVASAIVRDTWNSSSTTTSNAVYLMIDTYGITSTNQAEFFDDENRRQNSGYNGGNSAGNWNSTNALSEGQALVYGGRLQIPNTSKLTDGTLNADWSSFKPPGNPNYSSLGGPASYYRTIVDTSGLDRSSFQLVFTGTFATSATADLAANLLVIKIRRRASSNGGQAGPTCFPLYLSGALYDFSSFDDGFTNGQIREATSSGNTVNGTFGGFSCNTGIFIEIMLNDVRISIDSFQVVFF
jgi:hypothetical protein